MDPSSVDNLSLILAKKGKLELEQRPVPTPGAQDVLIAINTVGICGSDIHYWLHGSIGSFVLREPMVLGHETSGTVVKVGASVKSLRPGDRVAIEPGVPCRMCSQCKTGAYNLCADIKFCATPPFDGTLTRYFSHPEDFCFKLPDHVNFEEGAFLEPLTVAVYACKKARVSAGQRIFISGAGPIGLLVLLVCKAIGISKICISDIDDDRLKFAKKLGAENAYLIKKDVAPQVAAAEICECLGGKADVSIDCCGFESSLQTSIQVTTSGGTLKIIGLGQENVNLQLSDIVTREINIQGSFRYANCYQTALELVASGKVNVKPLITHRFKLEQAEEAFKTAGNPDSKSIKVMINCAP